MARRTNRHMLTLTDAELALLNAAADLTHPTAKGNNLNRAIRAVALPAAESEIREGMTEGCLLEALERFEVLQAYRREEAGSGDTGLDWYNDCAERHPEFSQNLTDALCNQDSPEMVTISGDLIAWNDQAHAWEQEGDALDLRWDGWFADAAREAGDLEDLAEALNKIGEFIDLAQGDCDQAVVEETKRLACALLEEIADGCDEDIRPTDTAGVWAWGEAQVLVADGWRFSVVDALEG